LDHTFLITLNALLVKEIYVSRSQVVSLPSASSSSMLMQQLNFCEIGLWQTVGKQW